MKHSADFLKSNKSIEFKKKMGLVAHNTNDFLVVKFARHEKK